MNRNLRLSTASTAAAVPAAGGNGPLAEVGKAR